MDPGFALFNNHINDAGKRALAFLDKHFPDWAKDIRRLEKKGNGIMYILKIKPKPSTSAFLALVTLFVNEKKATTPQTPQENTRIDDDMATGEYGAPCDPKRFGE